jgi:hypothetical protein
MPIYIIQRVPSPILCPTLFSDVSVNKLAGIYVLLITLKSVYEKSSTSRRLAYVRNVLRNVTLTQCYCHGFFLFG